ncbi:dicarboxylate/amino acid:cation symporter [Staphylococcus epidermidis]|uniref:dicarboxylate/amino acid:cation symporter n=1 Tax=Staphylococcus epidermidis TaxID=1282 RepID=UPI0021B17248|nr:dicarboxylate/amino acid:cation symporter [Staphylococcus epidermidis]
MGGVGGVCIVVLLRRLSCMKIGGEGVGLIIGVDGLLDMVGRCVNVIGNGV